MIGADVSLPLSSVLRSETRVLHRRAESTGIVRDLVRGRASRRGYALFLRNLHPAYEQLELGLERRPALADLARREVYRASAIASDLRTLFGAEWPERLPLISAGRHYANRIAQARAEGAGEGLIGHAYVRYFGDLNGGQILKRRIAASLDLPLEALSFHDFPQIDDLEAFRRSYREALDRSAASIGDRSHVIEAAREAFLLNIRLSQAVQRLTEPFVAG